MISIGMRTQFDTITIIWEWERTRQVKKEFVFPSPAQLIRSDLESKTRTNLPINPCAEMLTRTLKSEPGLFSQAHIYV